MKGLDWGNESYTRLYRADTPAWRRLRWEAQAVYMHVLRRLDRAGTMPLDGLLPYEAVAEMTGVPDEVAERALEKILWAGFLEVNRAEDMLVDPEFMDREETPMSDAQRKRESRATRRDRAKVSRNVTEESRNVPNASHGVTRRHAASQPVTPCLALPCLALPSEEEEERGASRPSSSSLDPLQPHEEPGPRTTTGPDATSDGGPPGAALAPQGAEIDPAGAAEKPAAAPQGVTSAMNQGQVAGLEGAQPLDGSAGGGGQPPASTRRTPSTSRPEPSGEPAPSGRAQPATKSPRATEQELDLIRYFREIALPRVKEELGRDPSVRDGQPTKNQILAVRKSLAQPHTPEEIRQAMDNVPNDDWLMGRTERRRDPALDLPTWLMVRPNGLDRVAVLLEKTERPRPAQQVRDWRDHRGARGQLMPAHLDPAEKSLDEHEEASRREARRIK